MPPSNPTPDGPILLFDGACNLCNSVVRWIIERDRGGVFRFASLQSDAAANTLASRHVSAGDLPDSVVLVDAAGVHTRSAAALRVARHLGFPFVLLAVALLLPRFVRDGVYAWIARNRYRWFGRQNACMTPSPELRARFLDADEPLRAASPRATETSEFPQTALGTQSRTAARRTLSSVLAVATHRCILAYLLIYILPFPFDMLAGVGGESVRFARSGLPLAGQTISQVAEPVLKGIEAAVEGTFQGVAGYEQGKRQVVTWFSKAVLAKEISIFPGGSGDTTYNYVEVLVFVLAALAIGVVWTFATRGSPVSLRVCDFVNVLVRYNLAAVMLSYGWHKVWPIQMPAPGPDRLIGNIGDMSPMGILWTLMGTSAAYQIFGGLGEVAGGALLLFRRTALLGALVTAGVMANVVALNFCFDVPVKLFSSHLLLQAVFLIAPHAARLLALLLANLPAQPAVLRPFPVRSWAVWTPLQALKLAVLACIAVKPGLDNYRYMLADGALAPKKAWEGVYRVESFTRDGVADRALEDADRWVRVGLSGYEVGAIQRASGHSQRYGLKLDEAAGTLTILTRGDPQPSVMKFRMASPGVIELDGTFQGAKITTRLRRDDEYKPLLTTRGFHWINEYPLNR